MVFFNRIEPTEHYLQEHEKHVSWDEVISIISTIKNPRRKLGKFEIEKSNIYILFEIKNKTIYVINAKRMIK